MDGNRELDDLTCVGREEIMTFFQELRLIFATTGRLANDIAIEKNWPLDTHFLLS